MFSLVLWCLWHSETGALLTLSIFCFIMITAQAISVSSCCVINDSKAKSFEMLNICSVSWRLVGWAVLLTRARLSQACTGIHSWICYQLQGRRGLTNQRRPWLGKPSLCHIHKRSENFEKLYHNLHVIFKPHFSSSYILKKKTHNFIIHREEKGLAGASSSKWVVRKHVMQLTNHTSWAWSWVLKNTCIAITLNELNLYSWWQESFLWVISLISEVNVSFWDPCPCMFVGGRVPWLMLSTWLLFFNLLSTCSGWNLSIEEWYLSLRRKASPSDSLALLNILRHSFLIFHSPSLETIKE